MKFGCTLMGLGLRWYPEVAVALEESGFESLWVPEHLVFPAEMPTTYPYSESGYPPVTSDTPSYDPWVLLSYVAGATERIRLGTNIYIVPLRHPLQTARSVVTLDRVSGGRAILGVGVGWLEDEFRYLNLDFASRGRRADAAIKAIRQLWTEETTEVHDEFFDFGPLKFNPKPLHKPWVPIEVGGTSSAALRRAGAIGDGWIEVGSTDLEDFRSKLEVVQEARRASGRSGPFEVTVHGTLASGREGYRRLEEAGATRVIITPQPRSDQLRLSPEEFVDWGRRFADDVIERI